MPVYLATVHSYRSWREDHPRGYIQHHQGEKPPNPGLARWRAERASQRPTRFSSNDQTEVHEVVTRVASEKSLRLHACATTPTHVHSLVSFEEPTCTCREVDHCFRSCPAYRSVSEFLTRFKQLGGSRLAKRNAIEGRIWFSRGWQMEPVRTRDHFDYLMTTYLPKHEREAGIIRIYR